MEVVTQVFSAYVNVMYICMCVCVRVNIEDPCRVLYRCRF